MIVTLKPIRRWRLALRSSLRRIRPGFGLFTLVVLFPVVTMAQSPFDTGFTAMQTLFTGTVAKVARSDRNRDRRLPVRAWRTGGQENCSPRNKSRPSPIVSARSGTEPEQRPNASCFRFGTCNSGSNTTFCCS